MRYKDFIMKKAIKEAYNIYIQQEKASLMGQIYVKLGNKLGYKMIDEEVIYNIKPTSSNKTFITNCERYTTTCKNLNLRYLDYNMDTRMSIYFDEEGNLYQYDYMKYKEPNGGYCLLPREGNEKIYDKHKEFLDFAVKYYKEVQKNKVQYLLMGYDNKHYYYLGSDGKCYYKIAPLSNNYLICTPKLIDNMREIVKENIA